MLHIHVHVCALSQACPMCICHGYSRYPVIYRSQLATQPVSALIWVSCAAACIFKAMMHHSTC